MNERIDKLMYHAGLTAQGCWDEMDEYDRKAIEKFAELIVRGCIDIVADAVDHREPASTYVGKIKEHFGVERSYIKEKQHANGK